MLEFYTLPITAVWPRGRFPNDPQELTGDSQTASWTKPPRWGRFGQMHVARGRVDGEYCSRGALGPEGQAAKEALTLAPLGAEGALPQGDLREARSREPGLGSPVARLVGSWSWRLGSSPPFVLALPRQNRTQVQGAPAGRPRLCLLLCQQRAWQAGQERGVGPRGLEACQALGSSFHFISSALPTGVTLVSRLPAGPRPSPSLDASVLLLQARQGLRMQRAGPPATGP